MRKNFYYSAVIFLLSLSATAQDQQLSELIRIKQGVKSKRVSSYDRSGDNHDNIPLIKSGEKRTIFDVPGSGIINHIWITMGPEPNVLSRNDVIIRMYAYLPVPNNRPGLLRPVDEIHYRTWQQQCIDARPGQCSLLVPGQSFAYTIHTQCGIP